MKQLLTSALFASMINAASAESWYYVNPSEKARESEQRCILLSDGQTPKQSVTDHLRKNIQVGLDEKLKDGSRILILKSPSGTNYAYTTSKEGCEAAYSGIMERIGIAPGTPDRTAKKSNSPTQDNVANNKVSGPSGWYSITFNHDGCISSMSPADKIRMLQETGITPRTTDVGRPSRPTKVEVSYSEGEYERVFTFWRNREECFASLPRNQKIPSKYE